MYSERSDDVQGSHCSRFTVHGPRFTIHDSHGSHHLVTTDMMNIFIIGSAQNNIIS